MRIGVDLGGTKIELCALSDDQTAPLLRRRVATPQGDYHATVDAIRTLVYQAEAELGCQASVGVCIPGTLSPDHGRVKNANSVCLIDQPLDRDLQQALQRPVRLANDADCFALSEASDGVGAGATTVFGVILGTGVGGGIVHCGRLLSGPNRIAGEWGHNPLPWRDSKSEPALPCYCGKRGCIETYLSGPGFARHYQQTIDQLAIDHQLHGTNHPPSLTAEQIVARADAGEPQAQQALERYCDQLARSLAGVINLLDPERIVLGGGLSNIDPLYQRVPELWEGYVFSDKVNTQLLKAQHGDASGVRGAAWLWP